MAILAWYLVVLNHNKLDNNGGKNVGCLPPKNDTSIIARIFVWLSMRRNGQIFIKIFLNPNCKMDMFLFASYLGNTIPLSNSGGWWFWQVRSWCPFIVVSPKHPLCFVKLICFLGNPSSRQAASSSASSSASDLEARKEAGCRFTASTPARRVDELNCLLSDITGKGQGPRKLDTKREGCSSPRDSSWCPWLEWCIIKAIYVFLFASHRKQIFSLLAHAKMRT